MIIRKLFKFENAHVVRGCTSERCKYSIHGHSYKIEVLFESNYLDQGQMVYDFGLTKTTIKDLIDAFDHAITLWSGDDPAYIADMKKYSKRWVELPVSPSAEQFSRVIFVMIDRLLSLTQMQNGEKEVHLHSIIVHETDTGYAQGFREDADNGQMGKIDLKEIRFSEQVKAEWHDPRMWEKLLAGNAFVNPEPK
ncbi:MAG TPA: 6-carboxytetrahydropterin synthase [Campylobacteraceae bacterium]|nr:6-carboxytetrahydropterin synthase [Campylobacteraceae bacterium]